MGYSDRGFDPHRGIERIGLKVSAQSDRVRRANYRPFHGQVTISKVKVSPVRRAQEPEVREVLPGRVHPMQPRSPEAFLASSGVDRPWPLGWGFSGPVAQNERDAIERSCAAMAHHGFGFTRV
jgi:hypothetical protein